MIARRKRFWTLSARWVFPVDGPPIERGVVTIGGRQILAVEPCRDRTADVDFGPAAILPGLVNAHTHLDLARLGKGRQTQNFIDWLRTVIQQRRSLLPKDVFCNIRTGVKQSLACGTTLLGDISSQGLSWSVLAKARGLRAVVFAELLGLTPSRAHQSWAAACEWLGSHPRQETCRPGLSPHAPYSVRASLFRAAAALSQRQSVPLTIHLAESREELELLEHHRGPFVPFLSELGVWDAQGLACGVDAVLQLNAAAGKVLFVHGNYLTPPVPLPPGASVVFCPRTHAAFGHQGHPFRQLLADGVRVVLGTDSLASNPDLDVLAEARYLRGRYPDVPGSVLLRMVTLSGAEALGWEKETGSLLPGKSAELIVLPLPAAVAGDPYECVFASSERVEAVLFRGRWVYRRSRP